jgi:hypothetical protein
MRRTDGRTDDHEEKPIHRGADRPRLEPGGSGHPGRRGLPQAGVSEQTFYRWKRFFAGMSVAELRRLRQVEEENRKLK